MKIVSFDKIKDKIIFILINKNGSENTLKTVPYTEMLDLAIVYGISLPSGLTLITNEHIRYWGKTVTDLHDVASKNTPKILPYNIKEMSEILGFDSPIKIVTTIPQTFGATAILYDGMLEALAEKVNDDLYLIPSSTEEFLVFPVNCGGTIKEINEIIKDINKKLVSPDMVLSDHVYYYNQKTKEIESKEE